MPNNRIFILAVALAIGLGLSASPAEAQGKSKGKKGKPAAERLLGDWYGDYTGRPGNGSGSVPPGWCKGKGNPHNTPENCGYRGRYDPYDRYGGRYDDRYDRRSDRYGVRNERYGDRYGRGGSYDGAHRDFHLYLDRKYSVRAVERPLDLSYQIRLRAQKAAEHDQWHARMGRRH